MYICLCNGFTDTEVERVAEAAGGSVARAYRALGCRPQCGKCVPHVRRLVGGGAGTKLAPSQPKDPRHEGRP